jgi:hypothetical protein
LYSNSVFVSKLKIQESATIRDADHSFTISVFPGTKTHHQLNAFLSPRLSTTKAFAQSHESVTSNALTSVIEEISEELPPPSSPSPHEKTTNKRTRIIHTTTMGTM